MKPFTILTILLSALCAAPLDAFAADSVGALNAARTSSAASDQAKEEGSEFQYTIGPQNTIQIKIFGEGNINQIYRVDEAGYITHALTGRIRLGGLSVSQAEKAMEKALRGDYIVNPHVTIFVLEHSRFSVLGEVRKPGTYEIQGRVSLMEAISMAGGLTPVASQGDVKIVHKSDDHETTETVDFGKMSRGENKKRIYMEPDDVIMVSKSFF